MANGRPGRPPKYTDEFKRNAVDYYLSCGKTQSECADDLGVPRKSLSRWAQERSLSGEERDRAGEMRAMRKEIERLRKENEFLKKAAAFFAANQ